MSDPFDRALDRLLGRLEEPVLAPGVMARMIAEIPTLPQLPREEREDAAMASLAAAPERMFDQRWHGLRPAISGLSVVGGLAACLCAVLLFPQMSPSQRTAPEAAQVVPAAKTMPQLATVDAGALVAPAAQHEPRPAPVAHALRTPADRHEAQAEPGEDRQPAGIASAKPALTLPPADPAPVAPPLPEARLATTLVGPPAPTGADGGIGSDDGTAIPELPSGPRAPSGMGFDGGSTLSRPPGGFGGEHP